MKFNWVHFSDYHHRESEDKGDRNLLRQALLDDVRDRAAFSDRIDQIDLCIFSGDMAFSGEADQYTEFQLEFIEPMRNILGEDVPFIFCPGNHDFQRSEIEKVKEFLNDYIHEGDKSSKKLETSLSSGFTIGDLSKPFRNYLDFCKENNQTYSPNCFHFVRKFDRDEKRIGFASLNSAWCSSRTHSIGVSSTSKPIVTDYGYLRISERQILDARNDLSDCDIKIAIFHHPINWLTEQEQSRVSRFLQQNFDVVIYGHEHRADLLSISGGFGDIISIPAGACFTRRNPGPMYTNSYNFTSLDMEELSGITIHREWNDALTKWDSMTRFKSPQGIPFLLKSKFDSRQALRRRLAFSVEKRFNKHIHRRIANRAEVLVKHELLDNYPDYIKNTMRYQFSYEDGSEEHFTIRSRLSASAHSDVETLQKIWSQEGFGKFPIKFLDVCPAPLDLPVSEKMEEVVEDDRTICYLRRVLPITTTDASISYAFSTIDKIHGTWTWKFNRFMENVTIRVQEDASLLYEYLPVGGFPEMFPITDQVTGEKVLTTRSVLHQPLEGYLIQWYPRRIK